MIGQRLAALRQEMARRNIAMYIVPTADFHESEYVGDYFKAREYITGFTGSAGVAIITMTEAGLWTDGRYFVQAEQQLQGTEIKLYRSGEEGVPTENEYIEQALKDGETLGFDGRVVNGKWGRKLSDIVSKKNGKLLVEEDLVGRIWSGRPALPDGKLFILEECYSGEATDSKIERIRKKMREEEATVHLISSLCDISWILNLRLIGPDILYVPVELSYLVIEEKRCIWFVQRDKITEEILSYLQKNGIDVRAYEAFYSFLNEIPQDAKVWFDSAVMNYRICCSIPKNVTVIDKADASYHMKAVKNEIQLANIRNAHLKDAVAMCKFMYWLKNGIGKFTMTELSVSLHLWNLRRAQDGFIMSSFETICGYGEHGAIVHYAATEENNAVLKSEGLLLVDSGAHYLDGTTDVTRTFALGELTQEMKENFTRVCRANINLANASFRYGCAGQNLDIIARAPLWEAGLDYNHGTGHGVGYILNVHEGPNAFRWRLPKEGEPPCVLEEGMVTTDEPGLYIEGQYGIRTESELICRKGEKNSFGQFMYFENVTYVPIDLDAILPEQMTEKERQYLNEYHGMVYEKVAPFLTQEEAEWLRKYTRAI